MRKRVIGTPVCFYQSRIRIWQLCSPCQICFLPAEVHEKAGTKAPENNQNNNQVGGSGQVIKILPDDTQGSRHQKFIVELQSGLSLLIAHNLFIASRITPLNLGDHIDFYGEYKWNSMGGLVHWTHHDPNGHHAGGWLNHGGKK